LARPDIYGPKADRLTRLAVLERSEEDMASRRETPAPPLMRVALGAIGGMFLCLAQYGARWAWLGAASFMLAVCGSSGVVGAAAGALAAAVACFRAFNCYEGSLVFWLILSVQTAGGALAGSLASVISRRLPPQAFAFIAALLPAGFEHLASFGADGPLISTALSQYGHPVIICIGRLGGLAAVTYVIFLFGGAVAIGVRYIRSPGVALASAGSALGVVLAALLFGALSSASGDTLVQAAAMNLNSRVDDRQELFKSDSYDPKAWEDYTKGLIEQAGRVAGKQIVATAIGGTDAPKSVQLVVWPEAQVAVDDETRPKLIRQIEMIARNYKCTVAAAFYDAGTTESAAVLAGTGGAAPVQYARRRFASGIDDEFLGRVAKPGTDPPQAADGTFGKVGIIHSLDANNFENFASIARSGGNLACVCGLDDNAVRRTSFPLLVFNAALSGLAVVRSVHSGTLAAISPDGKILSREAAPERIDAQVLMTVPLGTGRTLFLVLGNLFAWVALFAGIGAGLYASTLPAGPAEEKTPRRPRPTAALSYRTKEGVKEV
jgi:apolipoprotein N-acyltransferase